VSTASNSSDIAPIVVESAAQLALVPVRKGKAGAPIVCRRTVTLLGTQAGCKVVLHDKRVAPVHAAIVNTGERILAVDLVTQTGTQLNGLKLEHEELNDGDMLAVGAWSFRVDITAAPRTEHADLHRLGLDPTPHVVALEHLDSGRILQSNRGVCVIGRRSGCDIVISDPQVSRTQCLLFDYQGNPIAFDLLSRNHTLVNDKPITHQQLRDGDIITLGGTCFRLRIVESKVGQGGVNGKQKQAASVTLDSKDIPADEIDIETTEKSQRWRIAERLEKATRKS